jgi:peroxiredoxin
VLPISAAVIMGAVIFKLTRRYEPPADESANDAPFHVRPAPSFQLYDQNSRTVRLASYIGRHKLLIIFFDGSQGPDHSQLLSRLRDKYIQIHATGAIVLALSAARPSQNRYGAHLERLKIDSSGAAPAAGDELRYPFSLLSDILDYEVHRQYQAFDERTGQPLEAVFIVDRTGLIQYAHIGPDQLEVADDWVRELREVR